MLKGGEVFPERGILVGVRRLKLTVKLEGVKVPSFF